MPKKEKLYDNTHSTSNSTQLAILKKHFPNCFDKEGNFMSHKMEEIVGEAGLELSKESYALNWLGKSYARLLANENPRTLLKEDKVHNTKEAHEKSENLLIKGDNLEVLKHLSNAYSESIKMIYIDPPYNTGGDGFVYNDDRKFTVGELSRLAGIDEDEAGRILEFTSSKSNSHSAWLTFMYPRLYVARELLREDGVIFISIDENEYNQLKLLCNEIFGEENSVGDFIWKNKHGGGGDSPHIVAENEYILVYAKQINNLQPFFGDASPDYEKLFRYKDERGKYYLDRLDKKGIDANRPNLIYPIECPDGTLKDISPAIWRLSKKELERRKQMNLVEFKKDKNDEWQIYTKMYLYDENGEKRKVKPRAILKQELVGFTQNGNKEIVELFSFKAFQNPKPIALLKYLMSIGLGQSDLILDFFAGSGTTAHAVMALNAEDGGKRKFITVQIPEKTDEKSEAYKAGYNSIFDITKARIEKASEKLGDKSGFKIFETTPVFEGYMDDIAELGDNTQLFNGSDLSEDELETLLVT